MARRKENHLGRCPFCGGSLEGDETICPYCGGDLSEFWQKSRPRKKKRAVPVVRIVAVVVAVAVVAAGIFFLRSGSGLTTLAGRLFEGHGEEEPEQNENAPGEAGSASGSSGETKEDSVIVPASADIPSNALEIDGCSYYIFSPSSVTSYQEAVKYCEDRGGHLAVIDSDDLNSQLYAYVQRQGYKSAFFGYSDEAEEGNWVWVTGETFNYRNWGNKEPNAQNAGEDYAMFSTSEKNGKWNDSCWGLETKAFLCEWGTHSVKDRTTVSIPADAYTYDGHSYYIYSDAPGCWEEAEENCRSRGGYLAVINDSEENDALFSYMRRQGLTKLFFGYTNFQNDGEWHYIGGAETSFTDWSVNSRGQQEPNNEGGNEDNAALYSSRLNTGGYWNDCHWGRDDTTYYLCEWDTVR